MLYHMEIAIILKISKSIKLLVKMKNVSFILQEKPNGLFGQPIKMKPSFPSSSPKFHIYRWCLGQVPEASRGWSPAGEKGGILAIARDRQMYLVSSCVLFGEFVFFFLDNNTIANQRYRAGMKTA